MPGLSTLASVARQDDGDGEDVLERGTSIGRYLVLERLGAGAMGVVYAAYDQELDRKIAIKILRARERKGDEALRQERLIREAKAIAKLSHPNVVGIFDVGVHEDRVFLAMEYLGGGTLRQWIAAKKRPWREIVKMFIEVGQGLAAAHAEGLVHRDFKPDNVLLDKTGKPKVVDFGLVRLTGATLDVPTTGPGDAARAPSQRPEPTEATALASLTRTGAMTGTPAYMAPEQFLGKPTDARTDQFAFCVALYEALYGERPFAGETVMALAGDVVAERIRGATKSAELPAWVRRSVVRGLRADPLQRYPGFDELTTMLRTDPLARLRRHFGIWSAVVLAAAAIISLQRRAERRRAEFDHQVSIRINDGRNALAEARALKSSLDESRARAIAAFDSRQRDEGERIWAQVRSTMASLDSTLSRGQGALEAALSLDKSRADPRRVLAEVVFERALLAETEYRRDAQAHFLRSLDDLDPSGDVKSRWSYPGSLTVRTNPSASVVIERYELDGASPPSEKPPVPYNQPISTPVTNLRLSPGSYRVRVSRPGGAKVLYPFVLHRREALVIDVDVPDAQDIPDGFVFVPAGRFLFGDSDDALRESFLNATPMFETKTDAFLIAKNETTYGEWVAFLQDMPPRLSKRYLPSVSGIVQGRLALRHLSSGWELSIQPASKSYSARWGEPIRYLRRKVRAVQDWRRFPVAGISVSDMRVYLRWLDQRRGLRGARLCTEKEWERAARGADARIFPHGYQLKPDDANYDLTYGRNPLSFGPDVVGSHPISVSPFGIEDMSGNVMEVARSVFDTEDFVLRGGSYYYNTNTQRSTNREAVDAVTRTGHIGLRVCLDLPHAARRTGSAP